MTPIHGLARSPPWQLRKDLRRKRKYHLEAQAVACPSKFGDIIQVLFDKRLVSVINSLTCNMISDMIQHRLEGQIVENTSRLGH